ncbi:MULTISPECIES: L,D-transpeptidase [unclassified Sphingobacterium]|uniref:L,D-transpeptidase n=1 Tax=unclassified Sphingobacterium TaxID=2609468 RepID=UPI0025E50E47|nr:MULTISPECIES: L,D-transpeptidase [unclassified Sphingobacterium]
MNKGLTRLVFSLLVLALGCQQEKKSTVQEERPPKHQEAAHTKKQEEKPKPVTADDIVIKKDLLYKKYTLEDTYPYKDTTRGFQWDKIKEQLAFVENFQQTPSRYAVLQNYQNEQGEAPTIKDFKRDAYKRVADSFNVARYQAAPLYDLATAKPVRYGRDGWLVRIQGADTLARIPIAGVSFDGKYTIPKRYLRLISDSVQFNIINVVDVKNQNICTLEKVDREWLVRSMNPITSGRHKPPHAQETPTGLFVVQEHKSKMFYYEDGTRTYAGFAPYATRFTAGAYIHGVPVNNPSGSIIEYSESLGTTPKSHMCVRNASSHAQFVYKRSKDLSSLVIVID